MLMWRRMVKISRLVMMSLAISGFMTMMILGGRTTLGHYDASRDSSATFHF